ncbi:MAG: hypothetical protein AB1657_02640 [Candidatus Micrarchaeota archaeon]
MQSQRQAPRTIDRQLVENIQRGFDALVPGDSNVATVNRNTEDRDAVVNNVRKFIELLRGERDSLFGISASDVSDAAARYARFDDVEKNLFIQGLVSVVAAQFTTRGGTARDALHDALLGNLDTSASGNIFDYVAANAAVARMMGAAIQRVAEALVPHAEVVPVPQTVALSLEEGGGPVVIDVSTEELEALADEEGIDPAEFGITDSPEENLQLSLAFLYIQQFPALLEQAMSEGPVDQNTFARIYEVILEQGQAMAARPEFGGQQLQLAGVSEKMMLGLGILGGSALFDYFRYRYEPISVREFRSFLGNIVSALKAKHGIEGAAAAGESRIVTEGGEAATGAARAASVEAFNRDLQKLQRLLREAPTTGNTMDDIIREMGFSGETAENLMLRPVTGARAARAATGTTAEAVIRIESGHLDRLIGQQRFLGTDAASYRLRLSGQDMVLQRQIQSLSVAAGASPIERILIEPAMRVRDAWLAFQAGRSFRTGAAVGWEAVSFLPRVSVRGLGEIWSFGAESARVRWGVRAAVVFGLWEAAYRFHLTDDQPPIIDWAVSAMPGVGPRSEGGGAGAPAAAPRGRAPSAVAPARARPSAPAPVSRAPGEPAEAAPGAAAPAAARAPGPIESFGELQRALFSVPGHPYSGEIGSYVREVMWAEGSALEGQARDSQLAGAAYRHITTRVGMANPQTWEDAQREISNAFSEWNNYAKLSDFLSGIPGSSGVLDYMNGILFAAGSPLAPETVSSETTSAAYSFILGRLRSANPGSWDAAKREFESAFTAWKATQATQ